MVQFVEDFEEVPGGACDPIARPDQDNVEFAVVGIGQELIETGALDLGAADPVGVLLNDLEATLRGQAAQIMKLRLGMLIDG